MALKRLDVLMDAKPGSPEEIELADLSLSIEGYEKEHYPIECPTWWQAFLFSLDQRGFWKTLAYMLKSR